MNPQIQALYHLQQRDRQLTSLERKLTLIPQRIKELHDDVERLGKMLQAEREKCEETRGFQRSQEHQLEDEDEHLRSGRAKMQQVKSPRELNALQRELDQTRKLSVARAEEIKKIEQAVIEAEARIASLEESFVALQKQAEEETARLEQTREKVETKLARLKQGRETLTGEIETAALRTYERIRKRSGGIAFVAAYDRRCTACKMHIPHQAYVSLRKGDEILACESCGRLLYWQGHFSSEEEAAKENEKKPKASPPKKRPTAKASET